MGEYPDGACALRIGDEDQALLREAHQAAAGAYAPYSHFQVQVEL